MKLNWEPVKNHIDLNFLLLTFNAHSGLAHSAELLTPYEPKCTLRSSKALLPHRKPGPLTLE